MALNQADRIKISGEVLDLPLKIQSANDTTAQLAVVKADLQSQDDSLKIFFDKYNNLIGPYQNERRWVDGTTYATITNADIVTSAQKLPGNKFFPTDGSWTKFQPHKHPSSEGGPTTNSTNSELGTFSGNIQTGGLTISLDLLLNGQSSGVPDDTLSLAYINGSGSMTVTTGGQTIGKLLIVADGSVSGLFLVTGVAGLVLTVTEVIVPNGSLTAVANVVENIPAFTNTERNTLVSSTYQNILTQLTNNIKASVILWQTAINNQLTELNANTDSRSPQSSEITAAKADIMPTLTVINTWQSLPDTGSSGTDSKFVNINITPLQSSISSRTSFSSTRNSQITTALGSITQNPDGTFTGTGLYNLRFIQIDSRINLAGGPLTEYYEKNGATDALTQIVNNANSRLATYNAELRTEALSQNPNNTNTITVASVLGFSMSDSVFVMVDTQTELSGTISNITGMNITLSFIVPSTYTKALKARLYKQL